MFQYPEEILRSAIFSFNKPRIRYILYHLTFYERRACFTTLNMKALENIVERGENV